MSSYKDALSISGTIPKGHWGIMENRRNFANLLAQYLGYTKNEDWYNITQKQIYDFGGKSMLVKYYSGSAIKFVKDIISSELKEWLFKVAPQGFWNDINNVKTYIKWLFTLKGYPIPEDNATDAHDDCYNIRTADFLINKGNGLLDKYNNTVILILQSVFPSVTWYPWKFKVTTMGTWREKSNHYLYVKWLENKLGIIEPSHWYAFDCTVVDTNCGNGLLQNYYNHSLSALLQYVYPDYHFKGFMFTKAPSGYWDNDSNIIQYLHYLGNIIGVSSNDDWYNVSLHDFINNKGSGLIDKYGSYIKVITTHIHHEWDIQKFHTAGYSKWQINMLNELATNTGYQIRHKLNHSNGEFTIPGTRYRADGYTVINDIQIIIELHGCPFHGCESCFPNRNDTLYSDGITYQQRFEYTKHRKIEIECLGYTVFELWWCSCNDEFNITKWFYDVVKEKLNMDI
jgi:hypothetical protein